MISHDLSFGSCLSLLHPRSSDPSAQSVMVSQRRLFSKQTPSETQRKPDVTSQASGAVGLVGMALIRGGEVAPKTADVDDGGEAEWNSFIKDVKEGKLRRSGEGEMC